MPGSIPLSAEAAAEIGIEIDTVGILLIEILALTGAEAMLLIGAEARAFLFEAEAAGGLERTCQAKLEFFLNNRAGFQQSNILILSNLQQIGHSNAIIVALQATSGQIVLSNICPKQKHFKRQKNKQNHRFFNKSEILPR